MIANGHHCRDIGNYTERKIQLYYREAIRRERRQRADLIIDVNAAFAGGSPANDLIKALSEK